MLSRRLNELTAPIQELSKSRATNPLALVKKEHQPDSGIDTKKSPATAGLFKQPHLPTSLLNSY